MQSPSGMQVKQCANQRLKPKSPMMSKEDRSVCNSFWSYISSRYFPSHLQLWQCILQRKRIPAHHVVFSHFEQLCCGGDHSCFMRSWWCHLSSSSISPAQSWQNSHLCQLPLLPQMQLRMRLLFPHWNQFIRQDIWWSKAGVEITEGRRNEKAQLRWWRAVLVS